MNKNDLIYYLKLPYYGLKLAVICCLLFFFPDRPDDEEKQKDEEDEDKHWKLPDDKTANYPTTELS